MAKEPAHRAATWSSATRPTAATEPGDLGAGGAGAVAGAGSAAGTLAPGDLVGRYRVRRLIGEGGMGRVYLARDVTLGRSVALKIVRTERLDADDVDRFIAEARIVARLSHPHIVVLYDVGEHRGAPYLALEYLDGESLHERARREHLSMDEVLRLARAVAEALAHSHAAGVRHCDLKPSNVVLSNDGRIRVVDFGLAHAEGPDAGSRGVGGTPDWMAPEQWRREPVTDRTDVWALGVMVHELLAGAHPFGDCGGAAERCAVVLDASRPPAALEREGLDSRIVDIVARSLSRDPAGRPPCREWCRILDDVLTPASPLASETSPYRGLAAFDEAHAHAFFGRETEIEAFLERLRGAPVLPIVGPSGAGKSSFLGAGVIPRLRARERWTVIAMRPGSDPFATLAHHLLVTCARSSAPPESADRSAAEALAAELRAAPTLLALRLATVAAAESGRVLLAIDQLEELFTHDLPEDDVRAFLELLASASDDPAEPVRAVFTVRDDFLGRFPDLRQLFVLRSLGAGDLRRTIAGPLERTAYRLEDAAMMEEILSDIGDAAGTLPLLQFVCRSLWEARDTERRVLLRESYRRLGGVAGALARHADACMAELSGGEQRLARQLLTRLASGSTTRRVVERRALLSGLDPRADRVLDRLLSARLVTQRRSHGEAGFLIELAHESLLQSWDHLARWIDESREERRLLEELEGAASLWDRRGRHLDETWSADELVLARGRIRQLAVVVPPAVEVFLSEGERRHTAARRRSRLRVAGAALVAAIVTIGSIAIASELRNKKIAAEAQAAALRLAGGNLGRVDLELHPFDWVGGEPRPVAAAELPRLSPRFYAAARGDVHRPGAPVDAELVHIEKLVGARPSEIVVRVEAPGGMTFLRIDGRGRAGEECAPSWIRLQSLPGYADRGSAPRIRLDIPTCRASAAGMVEIPAGPFIYGGPGEPPTAFAEYVEAERTVSLPTYWIDRTEVTNAAYGPFAALEAQTGYPTPKYPADGSLPGSNEPAVPVTSIDAFTAEAFCRYMGKRLPGDDEWTKAARGGLELRGRPNPHPRRLYPWGVVAAERCANAEGMADGVDWLAPAESFPCGASPYGVLNLAGNVAEWISREGQTDRDNPLRVFRGGSTMSPPERQHTTTVFRNEREARFFDFTSGVRCAAGGGAPPWDSPRK